MSRDRRSAASGSAGTRPGVRVHNHDVMRRDVTVELARGEEVVAVERASLPRGGAASWRGVVDAPGTYEVTVTLEYGTRESVEWLVRSPGRDGLSVSLLPDGVTLRPLPRHRR